MLERFWSKVDKNGPMCERLGTRCWTWTSAFSDNGYGAFWVNQKIRAASAHRLSYEMCKGRLRRGQVCRHKCDNKSCVNPDHLLAGTHADNTQDAVERGLLHNGPRGESHPHAKLTVGQVREIRQRYASGGISQRALASEYGLFQTTVSELIRRKIWKEVA